jgi:hypothetical protein
MIVFNPDGSQMTFPVTKSAQNIPKPVKRNWSFFITVEKMTVVWE